MAILRVKLRHLDSWTAARQRKLTATEQLGAEYGLIHAGLCCPFTQPDLVHVYNQFVIRTQQRDELRERLTIQEHQTEIYYPVTLHLQPAFAYLGYQRGDFPEAELASERYCLSQFTAELTARTNSESSTIVGRIPP